MVYALFLAHIWHIPGNTKYVGNILKGKHGNNSIIYFLPIERFVRLLLFWKCVDWFEKI